MESIHKGIVHLPQPITVCLNDHNKNNGFKAILKSYQKYSLDTGKTYCAIKTANHWGFIHDPTSHWVKEINTVFLRAISLQLMKSGFAVNLQEFRKFFDFTK